MRESIHILNAFYKSDCIHKTHKQIIFIIIIFIVFCFYILLCSLWLGSMITFHTVGCDRVTQRSCPMPASDKKQSAGFDGCHAPTSPTFVLFGSFFWLFILPHIRFTRDTLGILHSLRDAEHIFALLSHNHCLFVHCLSHWCGSSFVYITG